MQYGRYVGGEATVTPGTASYDEVANVAALTSTPALAQQLRRVATNRLIYRTNNSGASWVPASMEIEVATEADLGNLSELVNNQYILVAETDWLWRWDSANGFIAVDQACC